jgi:hypothetical protein
MAVDSESSITVGTAVNVDGTRMVCVTLADRSAVIPTDGARMYANMIHMLADYVDGKNAADDDGLGVKSDPYADLPARIWEPSEVAPSAGDETLGMSDEEWKAVLALVDEFEPPKKKHKKRKKHKTADATLAS